MPALSKLRPDRDLQCYFQQPSAIAAMSDATENSFRVTGCWRQQFDWAVVEWNRDNVFEHPLLRNLPDGDLSGCTLTYEEHRTNCIAIDSSTYDALGWSYLRIWEQSGPTEELHWVPLRDHAQPLEGSYTQPTVNFELCGTVTAGDYVELSWLDQHFKYLVGPQDTLDSTIRGLVGFINGAEQTAGVHAVQDGATLTLTYYGAPGLNGNRVGVYGGIQGSGTEWWQPSWGMFSGGESPGHWLITLDFSNLLDSNNQIVPTTNVRKLRWTWAADQQYRHFTRSEFAVELTNWCVMGNSLSYSVAGPGSRRIEDHAADITYQGAWVVQRGNFSDGSIRYTSHTGSSLECTYAEPSHHRLYVGTRYLDNGGMLSVAVDGIITKQVDLKRPLEDALIRVLIGEFSGPRTITVSHTGLEGTHVYFDFLEIAFPTDSLPAVRSDDLSTLATDWDTDHSLALAPERTAWLVQRMGFRGRANHYSGAMWFYELCTRGNCYASAAIDFGGTAVFGDVVYLIISGVVIHHPILVGDTPERIAKCFELLITAGASAVWGSTDGATLTITARAMGTEGNTITISAGTTCATLSITVSAATLEGGQDGKWITDLDAVPRLNRAVRDWSRSYFRALHSAGIISSAAFSMELRHGEDTLDAGIAQRYPSGPVWLNTPALQTNFGPQSTTYWREVYREMADIMVEAGTTPYLQFGEVQWWYFADESGMPFYDEYACDRFRTAYGRPMGLISNQQADPTSFPEECELLALLIGEFTASVMEWVRQYHPTAQFEVLYPPDTNDTPLNRTVNFPHSFWTPSTLTCLKTENFTYTGNRDIDKARLSVQLPAECGFPAGQRSHLVGIGDPTTPWAKEHGIAIAHGVESAVLFALDQFCLIGYELTFDRGDRWSKYSGA